MSPAPLPAQDRERSRVLGWVILAIQFGFFGLVTVGAFLTGVGPRAPRSIPLGLVIIAIGFVVLWTAGRHLGRALTPHPLPNQTGLVAHGLYRWARHPIYTGVFLFFLGIAIGTGAFLCWVGVAGIVVMFEIKTRMEERWLAATYPGYAEYAERTGKYAPRIGRRRVR